MTLSDPLRDTGQGPEVVLLSVLDPAAFVTATLFALTLYWLDELRELGSAALLLVGAIATHMVADLVYFRVILVYEAPSGLPLTPLWLVAFGFQFLAADRYARMGLADEGIDDSAETTRRPHHGFLEAALPAPLLLGMVLVGVLTRDQISARTIVALTPLFTLFALCLGFREWWVDRAEERTFRRLEASMELTDQILAASPAAVFTLDPASEDPPTFLSPPENRPFTLTSGDRTKWGSEVHPEDRELFHGQIHAALEEGERSFECRLESPVGGYRWVNIRVAPYVPEGSMRPRLVGSIVDVDDAKRMQSDLLRGQRMEALGRLSGGIAHDFNNLLTTILGYAELGLMESDLTPAGRESLEAVKDGAERARGLTRQLLAFSRRQEMRMEVVDLRELVRSMTDMLARTLGDDVSVELTTATEPIPVRADPTQIEQVILNLVVNARDAMPSGGRLDIEVRSARVDAQGNGGGVPPGRYALLVVSDTGVGMKESVRERAFEPFFTTKAKGRGTGLGLATLHGVVRQHGGYVHLSSEVGQGTTFRIYLPYDDGPLSESSGASPATRLGPGSETILVVDDEPSIPRLIKDALTPVGYTVLTATNASEALTLAGSHPEEIDLLLTDVVMPEVGGRELADRLRAIRPDLRVVYMSGYADDSDLLREVIGGTVPFISKPLALGKLATLIRMVLDDDGTGSDMSPAER